MAKINISLHINLQLILIVSLWNMVICNSAKKRLWSRLWRYIWLKLLDILKKIFPNSNLELIGLENCTRNNLENMEYVLKQYGLYLCKLQLNVLITQTRYGVYHIFSPYQISKESDTFSALLYVTARLEGMIAGNKLGQ